MRYHYFLSLLLLLAAPAVSRAQVFTGFNLNTSTGVNPSSYPNEFVELNGKLYFMAADSSGWGIWQSDGTPAGTSLIRHVFAGGNLVYYGLTACNGRLIFHGEPSSQDTINGIELWTSDGTAAGTTMLKDLDPGRNSSYPSNITAWDNKAYFTATTAAAGSELWVSDGTAAGTILLKDINTGAGSSSPANFTVYNNRLYFTAVTSAAGSELWNTDGTAAGTQMVADVRSGSAGSFPDHLTVFNNRLFFRADDGTAGTEIWSTDGTAGGTALLADLAPGNADPSSFVAAGSRLFFSVENAAAGRELWSTDGTAAGTAMVSDINPGTGTSMPGIFDGVAFNGSLVFTATDGANGYELWKSDGTAAGTQLVKDIAPGAGNSMPGPKVVYNNHVYFVAAAVADTPALWVSDGTAAGTRSIAPPGMLRGQPFSPFGYYPLTVALHSLFFAAYYTGDGEELWRYQDGTPNGTGTIASLSPSWKAYPNPATDAVCIQLPESVNAGSWQLYDLAGRVIRRGRLTGNRTTLILSNTIPGTYLLQVSTATGRSTGTIVLQ